MQRNAEAGQVYTIRNLQTGRIYVGMSTVGKTRLKEHRQMLQRGKHPKAELQADWVALGADRFSFEIVEQCNSISQGLLREYKLIREFAAAVGGVYNTWPRQGRNADFVQARPEYVAASQPTVLANRVRETRLEKNLSMGQLAARAGMTRQNVALIERGQQPRDQTITALALALGVDRAWLFYVIPSEGSDAA